MINRIVIILLGGVLGLILVVVLVRVTMFASEQIPSSSASTALPAQPAPQTRPATERSEVPPKRPKTSTRSNSFIPALGLGVNYIHPNGNALTWFELHPQLKPCSYPDQVKLTDWKVNRDGIRYRYGYRFHRRERAKIIVVRRSEKCP